MTTTPVTPTYEIVRNPGDMPPAWGMIARTSGEIALRLTNAHGSEWYGLYSKRADYLAHAIGRMFVRNVRDDETPEDYICRTIITERKA